MIYLSSSEARTCLNISRQALEYGIHKSKYQSRQVPNPNGGKSGFKYEIALESLPIEAQKRYWQQVQIAAEVAAAKPKRGRPTKAAQAIKAKAEAEEQAEIQANSVYAEAPAWQKNTVDYRLYVVQNTLGMGRKDIVNWLETKGFDINAATVYRWRKAYEQGGKNALMSGYGQNKGQSIIPDDVFNIFCSVYMDEGRTSIQAAYAAAVGYLCEHYSVSKFPSVGAFEYRLRRDKDESARYFARYGESAWNRKYGRSITRDYSKILSGECAVGDHMQLDLMVLMPDGSVCRPWLTAWTDFKSRKLIGWDLHAEAPNSDHIFSSFRSMVSNYGLPKCIYIDNGKDYRCKDFAGGRVRVSVDEAKTSSLMQDLGIEVHFALPYNAQTKNIERRFRDFHNYCERLMPGYTATNIVKRPEKLKDEIKTGKLLSFAQASELINMFITEVLNRMPFGRGAIFASCCPDEIWAADNPVIRRASPQSLAVFCQRSSRVVTIGRNGVKDPDLDAVYWAEEFAAMKGRKVYLRRDIKNYAEAWVYSIEDELLCRAVLAEAIHPLADDEVSRAALKARTAEKRRERKAVRKAAKTEAVSADKKMQFLKAGIAAMNRVRGWEHKPESNVIEMQFTPLDDRAQQMEELRREATTNSPIYAVRPLKAKQKIYLSRTEMKLAQQTED